MAAAVLVRKRVFGEMSDHDVRADDERSACVDDSPVKKRPRFSLHMEQDRSVRLPAVSSDDIDRLVNDAVRVKLQRKQLRYLAAQQHRQSLASQQQQQQHRQQLQQLQQQQQQQQLRQQPSSQQQQPVSAMPRNSEQRFRRECLFTPSEVRELLVDTLKRQKEDYDRLVSIRLDEQLNSFMRLAREHMPINNADAPSYIG
ncbi:MAG: hypothetical protein MHM6MM_006452 [Cercozoa sp. M6MM]